MTYVVNWKGSKEAQVQGKKCTAWMAPAAGNCGGRWQRRGGGRGKGTGNRVWWHTPVIPPMQEVTAGGSWPNAGPG
jgi:hypothetical protein